MAIDKWVIVFVNVCTVVHIKFLVFQDKKFTEENEPYILTIQEALYQAT